jgi:hypothetical protein
MQIDRQKRDNFEMILMRTMIPNPDKNVIMYALDNASSTGQYADFRIIIDEYLKSNIFFQSLSDRQNLDHLLSEFDELFFTNFINEWINYHQHKRREFDRINRNSYGILPDGKYSGNRHSKYSVLEYESDPDAVTIMPPLIPIEQYTFNKEMYQKLCIPSESLCESAKKFLPGDNWGRLYKNLFSDIDFDKREIDGKKIKTIGKPKIIYYDNIPKKSLLGKYNPHSPSSGEGVTIDYDNLEHQKFIKELTSGIEGEIYTENQNIKTKNLIPFHNELTDYTPENVHVEQVLVMLNEIIDKINSNNEIMEDIFPTDTNNYKFGIIFKGGNVYKLAYKLIPQILNKTYNYKFHAKIKKYMKKSDCDFSLVIIENVNTDDPKFMDFSYEGHGGNKIYGKLRKILFIILSQFRNMLFNDPINVLGLCRNNRQVMLPRIKKIGDNIDKILFEAIRLFKKRIITHLIENLNAYGLDGEQLVQNVPNNKNELLWNEISKNNPMEARKYEEYYSLQNNENHINDEDFLEIIPENLRYFWRIYETIIYLFDKKNENFNSLLRTENLKNHCMNVLVKLKENTFLGLKFNDIFGLWDAEEITGVVLGDTFFSRSEGITSRDIINTVFSRRENRREKTILVSRENVTQEGKSCLVSYRDDFIIQNIKQNVSGENYEERVFYLYGIIDKENDSKTNFYISINDHISENIIFEKNKILKIGKNIKKFLNYGVGTTAVYSNQDTKYDVSIKAITKHIVEIDGKMENDQAYRPEYLDFSLGRLMVCAVIVYRKQDGNYGFFRIAGEFIDMSIEFDGDFKSKLQKHYNMYGKYDEKIKDVGELVLNNILYIKIQNFILDLYGILFIKMDRPWDDPKYEKRIWRFIYFEFIDFLHHAKITNNGKEIFKFMGFKGDDPKTDPTTNDDIMSEQNRKNFEKYIESQYHPHDNTRSKNFDETGDLDMFMMNFHLTDYIDVIEINKKRKYYFSMGKKTNGDKFYVKYKMNKAAIFAGQPAPPTDPLPYEKKTLEVDGMELVSGEELKYVKLADEIREEFAYIVYNLIIHKKGDTFIYPESINDLLGLMMEGEINDYIGMSKV